MTAEPILRVEGLVKHFPIRRGFWLRRVGTVHAVNGISFTVGRGETLGLVGESGSGKTTVAMVVLGVYPPTAGEIWFEGQRIAAPELRVRPLAVRRAVQVVFQDPGSSLNPRRTVFQALELPLRLHAGLRTRAALERRAAELLEMVELPPEFLGRFPAALSGGQRQRVAIARALATGPRLLVLDEPTSALDVSVQGKILTLLMTLQRRLGLTYLLISHDLSLMRNVATRVAVLYLGRVVEEGPTDRLFAAPRHPYTQMLLSAVPVVSEEEERIKPRWEAPVGEAPSAVALPPGCVFHPRCPFAWGVCAVRDPAAVAVGPGHTVRCHLYDPALAPTRPVAVT